MLMMAIRLHALPGQTHHLRSHCLPSVPDLSSARLRKGKGVVPGEPPDFLMLLLLMMAIQLHALPAQTHHFRPHCLTAALIVALACVAGPHYASRYLCSNAHVQPPTCVARKPYVLYRTICLRIFGDITHEVYRPVAARASTISLHLCEYGALELDPLL